MIKSFLNVFKKNLERICLKIYKSFKKYPWKIGLAISRRCRINRSLLKKSFQKLIEAFQKHGQWKVFKNVVNASF